MLSLAVRTLAPRRALASATSSRLATRTPSRQPVPASRRFESTIPTPGIASSSPPDADGVFSSSTAAPASAGPPLPTPTDGVPSSAVSDADSVESTAVESAPDGVLPSSSAAPESSDPLPPTPPDDVASSAVSDAHGRGLDSGWLPAVRVCLVCGGPHRTRRCKSPARKCGGCGKAGHFLGQCPRRHEFTPRKPCGACGGAHWTVDCPVHHARLRGEDPTTIQSPSAPSTSAPSTRASPPCAVCGGGHQTRQCRSPARTCSACGTPGHYLPQCPRRAEYTPRRRCIVCGALHWLVDCPVYQKKLGTNPTNDQLTLWWMRLRRAGKGQQAAAGEQAASEGEPATSSARRGETSAGVRRGRGVEDAAVRPEGGWKNATLRERLELDRRRLEMSEREFALKQAAHEQQTKLALAQQIINLEGASPEAKAAANAVIITALGN